MSVTVHGAGCALMDYLYRGVDLSGPAVTRYLRREPGDGGLVIGGLVFAGALERFAGKPLPEILHDITDGAEPDRRNVGGPAIVSLVHTAQLCPHARVRHYGTVGDDATGRALLDVVSKTPLDASRIMTVDGRTPATHVLSDPAYADGHGERLFVNELGTAADFDPGTLPDEFPRADIVQLGGTALVPRLHRALPQVLAAARDAGALTVVNTVYDFLAESERPEERWTLGSDAAWPLVDLLVADAEEAGRLSGTRTPRQAVEFFLGRGVGAAVVTNGAGPVTFGSRGGRTRRAPVTSVPVFSDYAARPEVRAAGGDTTGCGDTFVGGVVASLVRRMEAGNEPDLDEAVRLGIASGAFCLTHLGGTYVEQEPGEKASRVARVLAEHERHTTGGA